MAVTCCWRNRFPQYFCFVFIFSLFSFISQFTVHSSQRSKTKQNEQNEQNAKQCKFNFKFNFSFDCKFKSRNWCWLQTDLHKTYLGQRTWQTAFTIHNLTADTPLIVHLHTDTYILIYIYIHTNYQTNTSSNTNPIQFTPNQAASRN